MNTNQTTGFTAGTCTGCGAHLQLGQRGNYTKMSNRRGVRVCKVCQAARRAASREQSKSMALANVIRRRAEKAARAEKAKERTARTRKRQGSFWQRCDGKQTNEPRPTVASVLQLVAEDKWNWDKQTDDERLLLVNILESAAIQHGVVLSLAEVRCL